MQFAEPLWLLAGLTVCGLLLWAWRRHDVRQRAALTTFASAHLLAQLTASFSVARRRLKRALFLGSIALLFVALARPQYGYKWEEIKRRGIEILFAVDTSKSMMTPDVKPNRLTRAKLAVSDFVNHLNGDGVGLVAFAGNAFLQCPITLDYTAFGESLDALDTNTIPRGGTNITSAIREAQAALQNRTGKDKVLILLTDGDDLEGNAIDAAKAAAKDGLKIFTVGVGTPNGDLIPVPDENGGGYIKDDSGQYVKSHLDEATLKSIAEATGGIYAPLGAQGQGLETIYQTGLAPLTKHDLASRQQKVYIERFQWPLAASLGLLLASLLVGNRRTIKRKATLIEVPVPKRARRRETAPALATLMGAAILSLGAHADASPADAVAAYQKGDFQTAQREFTTAAEKHPDKPVLQYDAGTAAYKAGQYDKAAESFQKSLGGQQSADPQHLAAQQDAYYNLGNTLYRTGQKTEKSNAQETIKTWEQAVKSYESALQLNKDDADAKYNRDLVQKKLDELKKQQQQKQDQQKKDQQNKDQQKQDQDQKQDQSKDDSKQQNQGQQNPQNQSGQGSNDKNQEKKGPSDGKDQKDQKDPSGQNSPQQNPGDKDSSKPGSQPGQEKNQPADQKQDQGNQPDQKDGGQNQPKPDQQQGGDKSQPQPQPDKAGQNQAQGSPQAGNNPTPDQAGTADQQRVAGQMSKDEAKQLLDSLRDEQHALPAAPVTRSGVAPQQDQPYKDW